jgi:hypothetical protein
VGDDLAIEVDVGFGDGGDVFEFHGTDLVRGGGGRVKGESIGWKRLAVSGWRMGRNEE